MKNIYSLICVLFISSSLFAQAREGSVKNGKVELDAAIIDLPYPPGIVQDALNVYLARNSKVKSSDENGFITYKNAQASSGNNAHGDLHFKLEHQGKGDKEITTVSLALAWPMNGPGDSTAQKSLSMDQAEGYLNGLDTAVAGYDLELQIRDQNDILAREQAKSRKLADQGAELQKKRAAIDQDIQENKQAQDQQLVELQAQQQRLEFLISQRKPAN